MTPVILAASVFAALHGQPVGHHHPAVHCHKNRACIERVARQSCRTRHDAWHCRIVARDRWQRREAQQRAVQAQPAPAPAPAPSGYSDNNLADVPGVPPAFASCVALRESTDGAGSSNIYGIEYQNGYTDGMSLAAQKALFASMYAAQGSAPWSQYDGC